MAVEIWVYGNAKIQGDRGDYFVRACGGVFLPWKDRMIRLSNRLLSVERRHGVPTQTQSWFAGYLDKEAGLYVVAVAGEQGQLLGIPLYGAGSRPLFCVLAYGMTGGDIQLLRRDDQIFRPQKRVLRSVLAGEDERPGAAALAQTDGTAGRPGLPEGAVLSRSDLLPPEQEGFPSDANLLPDTPKTVNHIWPLSLHRPVMTGILSMDDGRRLIGMFPDGIAAVREGVRERVEAEAPGRETLLEQLRREDALRREAGRPAEEDWGGYSMERPAQEGSGGHSMGRPAQEGSGGHSMGRPAQGGCGEHGSTLKSGSPSGCASQEQSGAEGAQPTWKGAPLLRKGPGFPARLLAAVLAAALLLAAAWGITQETEPWGETGLLTETQDEETET